MEFIERKRPVSRAVKAVALMAFGAVVALTGEKVMPNDKPTEQAHNTKSMALTKELGVTCLNANDLVSKQQISGNAYTLSCLDRTTRQASEVVGVNDATRTSVLDNSVANIPPVTYHEITISFDPNVVPGNNLSLEFSGADATASVVGEPISEIRDYSNLNQSPFAYMPVSISRASQIANPNTNVGGGQPNVANERYSQSAPAHSGQMD